jgi:hypothetical protein
MSKSKSSKPRPGSPDTQARKREEKARRQQRIRDLTAVGTGVPAVAS